MYKINNSLESCVFVWSSSSILIVRRMKPPAGQTSEKTSEMSSDGSSRRLPESPSRLLRVEPSISPFRIMQPGQGSPSFFTMIAIGFAFQPEMIGVL